MVPHAVVTALKDVRKASPKPPLPKMRLGRYEKASWGTAYFLRDVSLTSPKMGSVPITGTTRSQGQKAPLEGYLLKPEGYGWTTEVDDKSYSCCHPRMYGRIFCPRTKNSMVLTD